MGCCVNGGVHIQSGRSRGSDFSGLFQHLKFIRQQRDQIKRVAAVTDSGFLTVMPHIVDHFIKADVRHFAYTEKAQALEWLRS
jgi:hypothetical protein